MKRRALATIMAGIVTGAGLLAGCGAGPQGESGGPSDALSGATITIGSKEFTESKVLGQLAAVALENAGATINDKTGISGSATVREALTSKQIDLYWDYTGTGWVNILGNSPTEVPEDLYEQVKAADAKNGVAWLKPAPFENAYGIAVKNQFATDNNLNTLSDAATYIKQNPDQAAVCAASEFIARDDGLPGVQKAYGFKFSDVVELDLNLVYPQIGKDCAFGEVTTTEARIKANDLKVLEDDQNFFIEYLGCVTLRQETLDQYPAIGEIMGAISDKLTAEVMMELNGKVDLDGETERDVAEEWLQNQGLI
ncbi:glycine betaine ABC transporter substrate-binding protein [Microlunatus speluncae]|uniref:ABC transporter substrate-binding protein n=1 Tax=Microlunatus speluncae TaxID=2594267 RepID=UPI0012666660|nr:glycine betaine ABC transporter substrate-binding protein [Microlunatus speluncae]